MKKKFIFFIKRSVLLVIYRIGRLIGLNKNTVSVLCYHGISENSEKHSFSKEVLESHLKKISQHSKFISLEKAFSVLDGTKIQESSVVLTFDDGFANLMEIIPIMDEYKIRPAVFVLSDPRNADRIELNNQERLLKIKEIQTLKKVGWTIGCHSANHANFSALTQEEAKKQIVMSKLELEKKLGFGIDFFAYPKGMFDENIINTVKEGGYKGAFSILPGDITKKSNRWLLPRTVIDNSHRVSEFPSVYSQTNFFIRKLTNRFNIWDKFLR